MRLMRHNITKIANAKVRLLYLFFEFHLAFVSKKTLPLLRCYCFFITTLFFSDSVRVLFPKGNYFQHDCQISLTLKDKDSNF